MVANRSDQLDKVDHNTLRQLIILPSVTNDQKVICDNDLTDEEPFDALKVIATKNLPEMTG